MADARVEAHWLKAEERLAAAHDLVTFRRYEDAVSRAYYAAFHAATATLLSLGIESKTHGGLRALFALHVVRPGLVARGVGRSLEDLYDNRRRSDYEVATYFGEEDAESALALAEAFLAACRHVIGEGRAEP